MKQIKRVGITGTREGCNEVQYVKLQNLVHLLKKQGAESAHHGDCIGVDHEFAIFADNCDYVTHCYPPTNDKFRAFHDSDWIYAEKDYMERDKDIVNVSQLMLCVPKTEKEMMRGSGTWATIRYCRKVDKTHIIILPSGQVLYNLSVNEPIWLSEIVLGLSGKV